MSHYFFDSSALVKRYAREPGTDWVRATCLPARGNTAIVAQITQIEIMSAVMRRTREGTYSLRAARAVRLLLEYHLHHEYVVVGLNSTVIARAQEALELYPLRAYDAIQLASALEVQARLVRASLTSVVFVASDDRLLEAAAAAGLTTESPPT